MKKTKITLISSISIVVIGLLGFFVYSAVNGKQKQGKICVTNDAGIIMAACDGNMKDDFSNCQSKSLFRTAKFDINAGSQKEIYIYEKELSSDGTNWTDSKWKYQKQVTLSIGQRVHVTGVLEHLSIHKYDSGCK